MSCFIEVLEEITPRQTAELTFIGNSLMPQQRIYQLPELLLNIFYKKNLEFHCLFLKILDTRIFRQVLKLYTPLLKIY